jgi:hypothetical protein
VRGAWLFARDGESFWIRRCDDRDLEVRLNGPSGFHTYQFSDEDELEEFLANVEERLLDTGWTFQRFESDEERRASVERRRVIRVAKHPRS